MEKSQFEKGLIYRTERTGKLLRLQPIDPEELMIMQDMIARQKPDIPLVQVPHALGERFEPINAVYASVEEITDEIHAEFSDHRSLYEQYTQAVAEYSQLQLNVLLNFVLEFGVTNPLPDDSEDETLRRIRRVAKASNAQYGQEDYRAWWLRTHIGLDEVDKLLNVTMGQSLPTPEGLVEAEARFRDDVEGNARHGVPVEAQVEPENRAVGTSDDAGRGAVLAGPVVAVVPLTAGRPVPLSENGNGNQ